jgi:hypothetical protein
MVPSIGENMAEMYPDQAPLMAHNFLDHHVDKETSMNSCFYRMVHLNNQLMNLGKSKVI